MELDVDIRAVKNFLVVAEKENITNAAEKLQITQPTLSRQILTLEEKMGVPLLTRKKTGSFLTDAGKTFYWMCKDLVREYNAFLTNAFQSQQLVFGSLAVAHQKYDESYVVRFHSEFLNTHPQVSIQNERQGKQSFVSGLLLGELDAAYVYGSELNRRMPSIGSFLVETQQNMLLVCRENPLSERERVHLSELRDSPFILPDRQCSPGKSGDIIDSCQAYGFTPSIASSVSTWVDLLSEIVRHKGVSIAPYVPAVESVAEVKYVELADYPKTYPIYLAWNKNNKNPALSAYLDFVRERLPCSNEHVRSE